MSFECLKSYEMGLVWDGLLQSVLHFIILRNPDPSISSVRSDIGSVQVWDRFGLGFRPVWDRTCGNTPSDGD
jgi:hypothetical protein